MGSFHLLMYAHWGQEPTPSPLNGERAGVRGEKAQSCEFPKIRFTERENLQPGRVVLACGLAVCLSACSPLHSGTSPGGLRRALTFHASFDHGPEADYAFGDHSLFTARAKDSRAAAQRGLGGTNVAMLAMGEGRFGNALRFPRKQAALVFYQAAENFSYNTTNWAGTVSFWLSVDPAVDLELGFCDPIQITAHAWNDAAFFVEFEKRRTIPFRLGVYADFKVWNPENRKWDEIPAMNRPLVTVEEPPFGRGKWTHVVFTFERFNTGKADGLAKLYLDGVLAGALPPRTQTFTWDDRQTSIMLGLGYVGLFDELSLFNRALSAEEVKTLYGLERGVTGLLRPQ